MHLRYYTESKSRIARLMSSLRRARSADDREDIAEEIECERIVAAGWAAREPEMPCATQWTTCRSGGWEGGYHVGRNIRLARSATRTARCTGGANACPTGVAAPAAFSARDGRCI